MDRLNEALSLFVTEVEQLIDEAIQEPDADEAFKTPKGSTQTTMPSLGKGLMKKSAEPREERVTSSKQLSPQPSPPACGCCLLPLEDSTAQCQLACGHVFHLQCLNKTFSMRSIRDGASCQSCFTPIGSPEVQEILREAKRERAAQRCQARALVEAFDNT